MEEQNQQILSEQVRKKYKQIRDKELGWCIQPIWSDKQNKLLYYINKLYNGRTIGHIICDKKELKNLKRFMAERKFE
jgi:hypothetical protein